MVDGIFIDDKGEENTFTGCSSVNNLEEYKITLPKLESKLYLHVDLVYASGVKKPNLWWRFWQYTLLGWKWEDYK